MKADRQKLAPWGLFGGKDGFIGQVVVNPDTADAAVIDSKKSNMLLSAGGVLSCRTPGAGGYGDPSKRDRNLIIRDLEQGFITPQCAKKITV